MADVGNEFSSGFIALVHTWVEGSAKSSSFFVREDFGIKVQALVVMITYQHEPSHFLSIELQPADRDRYMIESCPGTVRNRQVEKVVDSAGINNALSSWMKRVKTTLELQPHFRAMKDITARQEMIENTVKDFADEFVTRAEFDEFQRRFREMEDRLAEMARAQAESDAQAADFESRVHTAFELVRQRMESMTPKSAVRLVLTQVFGFLAKPETAQKILAVGESLKAITAGLGG